MLKITSLGTGDNLIIIPGGPGLSSDTMRSFDMLKDYFQLHYVDFPGANNNPYQEIDFWSLCEMLMEKVSRMEGKKILLGHSYGGFFSAAATLKGDIDGLICLSAPLSIETMNDANVNYNRKRTKDLEKSESKWNIFRDDESFREWLGNYGELYFTEKGQSLGKSMILKDLSSAQFFLSHSKDIQINEQVKDLLKMSRTPRIFIAGEEDGIISPDKMEKEALSLGFEFFSVPGANHFLMLDDPNRVHELVKEFIVRLRGVG